MMNETINFLSEHGALVLAAAFFAEQIRLPLACRLDRRRRLGRHGPGGAGHGCCLSRSPQWREIKSGSNSAAAEAGWC